MYNKYLDHHSEMHLLWAKILEVDDYEMFKSSEVNNIIIKLNNYSLLLIKRLRASDTQQVAWPVL